MNEHYERLFMLSKDMLCVAGLDGYFKHINPAFLGTLGHRRDEFLKRPWIEFVHPEDVESTVLEGKKLETGVPTINFENRYRCSDGTYKWLSWMAFPALEEKVIYAVARDITDGKKAEVQLKRQYRLLQEASRAEHEAHEALKQAQSQLVQNEKLASLGQMVAGVAHEINNPLAFVSNNVEVLTRDLTAVRDLLSLYIQGDPALAKALPDLHEDIQSAARRIDLPYTLSNFDKILDRSREGLKRIQQIVKDLRDFARLDENDRHDVDINQGIESTANIIHGHAVRKNIRIELDLGKVPSIRCQPAKINQVVLNLLSNAIDASKPDQVVTVRTRVDETDENMVRMEVIDQGSGISPDVVSRIFDPFFTTKPPGSGTGLGLSISYGIIQDHGGTIQVESVVGKGTRFIVSLPRAASGTSAFED